MTFLFSGLLWRKATLFMTTSVLGALAYIPAGASGLDCTLARQATGPVSGDARPARALLDQMARAHGLGILEGWTFSKLHGLSGEPPYPEEVSSGSTGWDGQWRTHPLNPANGAPLVDTLGSFQVDIRFGQPWLIWQVDISDPCEGRTDLPLLSAESPVLQVDLDVYHMAVVEGVPLGVPRYPDDQNEDIARLWKQAEPILSSIAISRQGETCTARYETSEGAVVLKFFCERY
jgi:hypothetical protein